MATMTREQVYDLFKGIVNEQLDDRLNPVLQQQTDWMGQLVSALPAKQPAKRMKGELVSRVVQALVLGKGDSERALRSAKNRWPEDKEIHETFEKALAAQDSTAGGFLIQEQISSDLIELLRPMSVVRSMNPVTVDLTSGTLRIPRHTTGSSGSWIGENQNLPATEPAFGQVVLTAKKYGSLVPISNDLIRRASANTDAVVRNDLVEDIAAATDLAFIRGDGLNGQPKGLLNWATNTTAANGTVNLANATADLVGMLQRMMENDTPRRRLGWLFAPRTWAALTTARDGNGNLVWQPEMNNGTLVGFPFRVTSQIPTNLGGGSDSEIYLADFSEVIVGESTNVIVNVSDSAAYHDGTNVVAAFSLDQTVIRAIVEVDLAVRHDESVEVLDTVTWAPGDIA